MYNHLSNAKTINLVNTTKIFLQLRKQLPPSTFCTASVGLIDFVGNTCLNNPFSLHSSYSTANYFVCSSCISPHAEIASIISQFFIWYLSTHQDLSIASVLLLGWIEIWYWLELFAVSTKKYRSDISAKVVHKAQWFNI